MRTHGTLRDGEAETSALRTCSAGQGNSPERKEDLSQHRLEYLLHATDDGALDFIRYDLELSFFRLG